MGLPQHGFKEWRTSRLALQIAVVILTPAESSAIHHQKLNCISKNSLLIYVNSNKDFENINAILRSSSQTN